MAAAEDLARDLVFVDLETTGGSLSFDRITEIGIVRLRAGGELEEWSSLVNPGRHIPDGIAAFNGITDDMVAAAPRFAEIARTVRDKLEGALFVAHNARFDYSFLRSEMRQAELGFSAPVLCTVKLSRRLFPEHVHHNLDSVMQRNGLVCDARHRALGDARVIRDFWMKLRGELPGPELARAVEGAIGAHKLPAQLPADLADELPEAPGAYRLFAADDALLYVGRSDSLRTGICGRLSADHADADGRRLAEEVRRIDWMETAGPLGALLLQARWIKAGKPPRNRRAKQGGEAHTLRAGARIEAVPIAGLDRADLMECFGLFHSEKDALRALTEIARARELCLKVLGLEAGEGSCFAHQMGKCKGACIGKEPAALHDMRVRLALASLKLKAWPFPGRIALRERPPWGGAPEFGPAADLHVIDRWVYVGTARTEEELAALAALESDAEFDADIYRILVRYLAQHPRVDWIELRAAAPNSVSLD
jgi:DNA polymerase-3 subunit epsilon